MSARGKVKLTAIVLTFALAVGCVVAVASSSIYKVFYPMDYTSLVEKYCDRYGLETELVYAVIKTESSFNPDAVSSVGASGLMQITPDTFNWLKTKLGEKDLNLSLTDEETSIKYGTYFLKILIDEFGNSKTALAAYHAGRGKVNEWLDNRDVSPDGKTLANIPYNDTAHYVKKVIKAENIYKNLY